MKTQAFHKFFLLSAVLLVIGLNNSCTKNTTPVPPVHDTLTIIKNDTTRLTDTLYHKIDTPNLQNGLLVYLKFNGNFADSSGNNNPTQAVNGAILTSDERGLANSAFGGTGNGERVFVTNNGSIKFDTAFSLAYHVMTNTFALQDFVTMVQNANGEGVTFGQGALSPNNHAEFTVMDSTATCSDIVNPGVNCLIDTSGFSIQPNVWYEIICIFHKGTTQIYVNGTLVTQMSGANSTVPICPAAKVIVGGWWDGSNSTSLNGKMDEFRLYNRVLNANEITWLARNYQPVTSKFGADLKTGRGTMIH